MFVAGRGCAAEDHVAETGPRCSDGRMGERERMRIGLGTRVNIRYRQDPGIEEQRETVQLFIIFRIVWSRNKIVWMNR